MIILKLNNFPCQDTLDRDFFYWRRSYEELQIWICESIYGGAGT